MFRVAAAAALLFCPATVLAAGGSLRLKAPVFPLEPDSKPVQKIAPETYVAGADEPPDMPAPDEVGLSRREYARSEWTGALDLGWFFSSQTYGFRVSSATLSGTDVNGTSGNVASFSGQVHFAPPETSTFEAFSFVLGGSFTSGTSELTSESATLALTRISVQDIRGKGGVRFHPWGGRTLHDLSIGVDGVYARMQVPTLGANSAFLDLDTRTAIAAVPRLEYRYRPATQWGGSGGVGYTFPLQLVSDAGATASGFTRLEVDARAHRYLSEGLGLGFGAFYSKENVDWAKADASGFRQFISLEDLRLSLFLRLEI